MDWAEDNVGIREEDFQRVWKYNGKAPATTVVEITSRDEAPVIHSLKSEKEWKTWLESTEFPSLHDDSTPSGLVLILAKRKGEREFSMPGRTQSNDWLSQCKKEFDIPRSQTTHLSFASSADTLRSQTTDLSFASSADTLSTQAPPSQGQRSVSTVPFSEETFRFISKSFHIHHSISSVVSRADIPAFLSAEVEMDVGRGNTVMANVYHSRTSNAWDNDLALTVTHFPHAGLTYAVLFGCPLSFEAEIIRRLPRVRKEEASHPLVLAGIFAELERMRHVATVEAMIDKLENSISQLSHTKTHVDESLEEEKSRRQKEKRDDYLDTAYVKNGLISWRHQLGKMLAQVEEVEKSQLAPQILTHTAPPEYFERRSTGLSTISVESGEQGDEDDQSTVCASPTRQDWNLNPRTRRAGRKIIGRLEAIMEEYDEKIRDCSMRLDGMEMATQWAQGETNVEIAMATGRDSKHMRSIAIVTMVFLPGTFFASIFSMSFFNWFNDDGSSTAQVSSYFWIYVVVTVAFTAVTIGLWYYFNIWRRPGDRKVKGEDANSMV